MSASSTGWTMRLRAAWRALCGGEEGAAPIRSGVPEQRGPQAGATEALTRVAALELDVRDRDEEIGRLRAEYERLSRDAAHAQSSAGADALASLGQRIVPALSQLATMQALSAAGRDVRTADVLKLVARLETALGEGGWARIGGVGDETAFDPGLHQRMSGADVGDGDPVLVRFVGYRLGETVLLKAMVSRRGAARSTDGE